MEKITSLASVWLFPLGGSPFASGISPDDALADAGEAALKECALLEKAGVGAILLENLGDAPFCNRLPLETFSALSILAAAIKESASVPVGLRLHPCSPMESLAIASVTGCDFICYSQTSDAGALFRERERLDSNTKFLLEASNLPSHWELQFPDALLLTDPALIHQLPKTVPSYVEMSDLSEWRPEFKGLLLSTSIRTDGKLDPKKIRQWKLLQKPRKRK